jgi:hypothetical protein
LPTVPRYAALILGVALLAACNGTGGPPVTTTPVAPQTPIAAVEGLQRLLKAGDFASASDLSVPGQAALASLTEGVTVGEVAQALEDQDEEVGANFWSGFAQGADPVFIGQTTLEDAGTLTESGVEFHLVAMTPKSGETRLIATRNVDGDRIDLFASFGAGLASRMSPAVELILGSKTEGSDVVLASLQDIVPSLLIAAQDPALSPATVQEILHLIEVITRVS